MQETNTSLSRLVERSEAEALFLWLSALPEPQRTTLRTSAVRIAGGVVCSMANDPVNYWSKALGFGFDSPVDASLVREVVDEFRVRGVREATIQIAPQNLPSDWDDIRGAHGLTRGNPWVKLAGEIDVDVTAVEPPESRVRVGRVPADQVAQWADVVFSGFGMPPADLGRMAESSTRSPSSLPFAAWLGDQMIGGASLFLHGETAHLFGASTLPRFRGLGAQSALIAARARTARESGARWLVGETGKPDAGGESASLSNMLRAGLKPVYERENWEWSDTAL
jgi:hypothetical protein